MPTDGATCPRWHAPSKSARPERGDFRASVTCQVLRQALNLAAQYGDRTFGQCHYGTSSRLDPGSDRRVVRLGVGSRAGRGPNVLLASERHHVHLAFKRTGLAARAPDGDLNLER